MARPIFSYFPQATPAASPYPIQDTLLGLGIGLLGNRNFGQGAAQGLQYANQLAGQRRAERRQDEADAREAARFGFEQQKYQTEQQQAADVKKGYQDFIGRMFDNDPTNDIPGMTAQQAMFLKGLPASTGYEMAAPLLFPKAETPTDDQREYQQAVGQGFKGTFLDYLTQVKKAGAPTSSTTIYNKDYGTIPPGYRLKEGPEGVSMEAVPGSPADQAATNRAKGQAATADIVTDDINRALQTMNDAILPTTGFTGGSLLSNVPNTASYDVAGLVKTIKGNVGIDKLQQMRLQSPTGGALGNVTESENATLQSLLGNLDQSQSDEQFRYNLKRVYNKYLDIVHGEGKGPPRYDLGPAAPGPGQTQQKRIKVDAQGNIINGD